MGRGPDTRRLDTEHGSVTLRWDPPRGQTPKGILYLAHGAGSRLDSPPMEALAAALKERGYGVLRFNFPYAEAGRGRPDPEGTLVETWLQVWERGLSPRRFPGIPRLAGGRSMGGRMATLAAARHPDRFAPAGLVLFAYPLHPPGRTDRQRTEHLAAIRIPMLFLSGTRDAFAEGRLLPRAVAKLRRARLVELEGADHGFRVLRRSGRTDADVLTEALDALDAWARGR